MPARLSELLERIRPAGAPGAPTEGEQQRLQFDRARETVEIAAALSAFEEEANSLLEAATTRSAELGRGAEREVRQIHAAVPGRVATVQAAALHEHQKHNETEQAQVANQTAAEVAGLQNQATALIPALVGVAAEAIWAVVPVQALPGNRQ